MSALIDENPGGASTRGADILYGTGLELHAKERYREAARIFQVMLHAAPTDERGWVALADCHERLGQRHVALELCSAGTVAAAPAPRCMLSRFRLLYDLDRSHEANEAFDAAVDLASTADDDELNQLIQTERQARP